MEEIVFERASYFEHNGYKIMEHSRAKRQWLVYREEWKYPGGILRDMVTIQIMRQFKNKETDMLEWHFSKRIKGKNYEAVRWPSVLNTAIAKAIMNCIDKDDNIEPMSSEDSIEEDLKFTG